MVIYMNLIKKITSFLLISVLLSACGGEEDASRIVIGDSNIIHDLNELQYQWPFVIQVSDIEGNPAPFTRVTLTVNPTFYAVGEYFATDNGWATSSTLIIGLNDFPYTKCRAEDLNNNAILDEGEDVNGSGILEPTNSSTLAEHPELVPTLTVGSNILITNEFGFGYFALTYPKSEGNWSSFRITAEASVSGTENIAILEGVLPVSQEDITDTTILPPGGRDSAYGLTASGCEAYID